MDGGGPQFLPAADAMSRERRDRNSKDSPQARCLPGAVLRFGPLFEFVQSDNYLVIINDDESPGFHQVYINGQHPEDPNPGWYGHNIARLGMEIAGGRSRRVRRTHLVSTKGPIRTRRSCT